MIRVDQIQPAECLFHALNHFNGTIDERSHGTPCTWMDLFSIVCRIAESNRGSKSSRQRGGATDRSGNAKNSQLLNQAWSKNEFTRDIKPLITLWTRVNFELVYANYKRKRIENRKRGEGEGEMYPANVSNEKKRKKERKKEAKKGWITTVTHCFEEKIQVLVITSTIRKKNR